MVNGGNTYTLSRKMRQEVTMTSVKTSRRWREVLAPSQE